MVPREGCKDQCYHEELCSLYCWFPAHALIIKPLPHPFFLIKMLGSQLLNILMYLNLLMKTFLLSGVHLECWLNMLRTKDVYFLL